jgi:hypothetical protein
MTAARCGTGAMRHDDRASLRWHYPDQVQRVFLTRAPLSQFAGPLAFAATEAVAALSFYAIASQSKDGAAWFARCAVIFQD